MFDKGVSTSRRSYHHGDLRRALLDAGTALAREGGPHAVVLREATRRAGVAPNAAYRHFANRQALLEAVRAAALAALAREIEGEQKTARRVREPRRRALAVFRGVGLGYLRFARQEPGLYRTAFVEQQFDVNGADAGDAAAQGGSGMDPYQLLCHAVDGLVDAGILPAAQRPGAEFLAWSAVHGLAMLVLEGPLRGLPDAQCEWLAERVVEMVVRGIAASP